MHKFLFDGNDDYDNADSGLESTTVKAAIDELKALVDDVSAPALVLAKSRIGPITWNPGDFDVVMPFTSANVTTGFGTGLIGASRFTAAKTGPHQIGASMVSTNFAGVTGAALGYGKNGSFTCEMATTGAPDGIRACVNFSDVIWLTAGDYIQFYGHFSSGTAQNVFAFMTELPGVV